MNKHRNINFIYTPSVVVLISYPPEYKVIWEGVVCLSFTSSISFFSCGTTFGGLDLYSDSVDVLSILFYFWHTFSIIFTEWDWHNGKGKGVQSCHGVTFLRGTWCKRRLLFLLVSTCGSKRSWDSEEGSSGEVRVKCSLSLFSPYRSDGHKRKEIKFSQTDTTDNTVNNKKIITFNTFS